MLFPVMKEDSSEARYPTKSATSLACPSRRSGVPLATLVLTSLFVNVSWKVVAIIPGHRAFTRMFFGPNSLAIDRVKVITAPFAGRISRCTRSTAIPGCLRSKIDNRRTRRHVRHHRLGYQKHRVEIEFEQEIDEILIHLGQCFPGYQSPGYVYQNVDLAAKGGNGFL